MRFVEFIAFQQHPWRGGKVAAMDVASLRVRTELARVHIRDHPRAQRADGMGLPRFRGQVRSWDQGI